MAETRLGGSTATVGVVLLAQLCCGCGGDSAVRLVLAPDPELNSAADVVSQVARIQVIVDAEGGLVGVDQPGPTAGGGEAVDRDGDGELEVVFTTSVLDQEGVLPVLEVGLGDHAELPLTFQVVGYPVGEPLEQANAIALGGASATCAATTICRVGTPFNLLARARAPRVIWVVPPDGTLDVPRNLAYLTAVFSTRVDGGTVTANLELVGDQGHLPATTAEVKEVVYGVPPAPQEIRSMLQLVLDEELVDDHYTLTIGPGILGENGLRFDQRLDLPGEDGFVSHFGNEVDSLGCPNGYEWNQAYVGCVAIADCSAGCGVGFACDPVAQQCVEDCRLFGACLDPAARCVEATGLCQ